MKIIYLSIFHYYSGFLGFLGYFGSAKFFFKKKYKSDLIFLGLVFVFSVAQLISFSPIDLVMNARFFWGWILFYIYFNYSENKSIDFAKILKLICFITIFEAVLVNTIVEPWNLPNYADKANVSHFAEKGSYQRPYSIGANASVTSSIIVVLMSIIGSSLTIRQQILSIITIILSASGTGFFILFLYYALIGFKNIIKFIRFFIFGLFMAFFLIVQLDFNETFFSKLSSNYISLMGKYIYFQYLEMINFSSIGEMLIGRDIKYESLSLIGRGGDNGMFSFVIFNGIFGLTLFLYIIMSKLNKINFIPISLIVVSSFHYPTIFFIPGQILFGYLLSIKVKD